MAITPYWQTFTSNAAAAVGDDLANMPTLPAIARVVQRVDAHVVTKHFGRSAGITGIRRRDIAIRLGGCIGARARLGTARCRAIRRGIFLRNSVDTRFIHAHQSSETLPLITRAIQLTRNTCTRVPLRLVTTTTCAKRREHHDHRNLNCLSESNRHGFLRAYYAFHSCRQHLRH